MDKPENPGQRCTCRHPLYLHRPGWCRAYDCDCRKFEAAEERAD